MKLKIKSSYFHNTFLYFLLFLFFIVSFPVFSIEFYTVPSVQTRKFVLSQILNTSFLQSLKSSTKLIHTQKDGKIFIVIYEPKTNKTGTQIYIRPADTVSNPLLHKSDIQEQTDKNKKNAPNEYGEWNISIDNLHNIQYARYYFQAHPGYYIEFSPQEKRTHISIYIEYKQYLSKVYIPISIFQIIQMNFDDIITNTKLYIEWEKILPKVNSYKENRKSQNIALYLFQNDSLFVPNTGLKINKTYIVFDTINKILIYAGILPVDELQFFPLHANKKRVSEKEDSYIKQYVENVSIFFLSQADFYTSMHNTIKNDLIRTKGYGDFLKKLYLITQQYAGLWYIVTLKKLAATSSKNNSDDIIGVLIPYFTALGEFSIYFSKNLRNFIKQEKEGVFYEIYLYAFRTPLKAPPQ